MVQYVAKITTKGQLTLPAGVRRQLGIGSGDYVRIESQRDGNFVLKAAGKAGDLQGLVRYEGPARSIDDIRAASRATFKS
jgi:AbrB family looped-hinge helix DNA binding protein